MNRWVAFLLYPLAFGCAHHVRPATDPPVQTIAKKSYTIPFEQSKSGVLIVNAIININPDHPEVQPPTKRLAIDTGASHTCFFVSNLAVADLAKIIPHASLDERLSANGSIVNVCHFPTAKVTLGNLSVTMPVDASGYDMTVAPSFDGVIGLDFLSRFSVRLDFQSKTMILTER